MEAWAAKRGLSSKTRERRSNNIENDGRGTTKAFGSNFMDPRLKKAVGEADPSSTDTDNTLIKKLKPRIIETSLSRKYASLKNASNNTMNGDRTSSSGSQQHIHISNAGGSGSGGDLGTINLESRYGISEDNPNGKLNARGDSKPSFFRQFKSKMKDVNEAAGSHKPTAGGEFVSKI